VEPLTDFNGNVELFVCQANGVESILVDELSEIFNCLPGSQLEAKLGFNRWVGCSSYPLRVIMRAYLASCFLNVRNSNSLIRGVHSHGVKEGAIDRKKWTWEYRFFLIVEAIPELPLGGAEGTITPFSVSFTRSAMTGYFSTTALAISVACEASAFSDIIFQHGVKHALIFPGLLNEF
jgi:hypothetical protein